MLMSHGQSSESQIQEEMYQFLDCHGCVFKAVGEEKADSLPGDSGQCFSYILLYLIQSLVKSQIQLHEPG